MFQSCLQDVPMKNTVLETDCDFSNTYGSFVDMVAACGCKCLSLNIRTGIHLFSAVLMVLGMLRSSYFHPTNLWLPALIYLAVQDVWLLGFICSFTDVFCFQWHQISKGESYITFHTHEFHFSPISRLPALGGGVRYNTAFKIEIFQFFFQFPFFSNEHNRGFWEYNRVCVLFFFFFWWKVSEIKISGSLMLRALWEL